MSFSDAQLLHVLLEKMYQDDTFCWFNELIWIEFYVIILYSAQLIDDSVMSFKFLYVVNVNCLIYLNSVYGILNFFFTEGKKIMLDEPMSKQG